ncbi:PIR protein, putative [Plasmodium sp.]|nr:PIR protein, putative [Plasmodium sp.]
MVAVNNQTNSYITPRHTPTSISRVLSECDIHTYIFDDDEDMKSVKENFDRQTSQRFEEYNEHMNDKRQKCKEQCDKDIQEIILKDKIKKSLAYKVEKGCLKCGCALGGGIAPVWGLVSGLWYATLSQYVSTTLVKMATDAGIQKGLEVGLAKITELATTILGNADKIPTFNVGELITAGKITDDITFYDIFKTLDTAMLGKFDYGRYSEFSTWIQGIFQKPSNFKSFTEQTQAVSTAFSETKAGVLAEGASTTSNLSTAIITSIIVIVVIVLVMIIIYLILRYRRKKKMNKKLQYTKLLKE